jgi:hypothetical protein
VTVQLEAGQGKRHFYREDVHGIEPPADAHQLLVLSLRNSEAETPTLNDWDLDRDATDPESA